MRKTGKHVRETREDADGNQALASEVLTNTNAGPEGQMRAHPGQASGRHWGMGYLLPHKSASGPWPPSHPHISVRTLFPGLLLWSSYFPTGKKRGSVAQLVERSTENRKVTGSTPVGATR